MSDGRDDTQARPAGEFIERRDELIKLWALAPTWTLREGACLANNVSPRLLSEHGNFPRRHPAAERVNRLIEFALRSMRQFKLSTDPTPAVFIAWSENVGFPFDAKWIEVIGKPRIPAGPGSAPTSLPNFSAGKAERAYVERVENWPADAPPPSRDDDIIWLNAEFGASQSFARKMRNTHAPEEWRLRGRRKTGGN